MAVFLRDIMGPLTDDSIGHILWFTAVPDHRRQFSTYGFFVELDGEIGMNPLRFRPKIHHDWFCSSSGRNPARAITVIEDKLQTKVCHEKSGNLFAGPERMTRDFLHPYYPRDEGVWGGSSSSFRVRKLPRQNGSYDLHYIQLNFSRG